MQAGGGTIVSDVGSHGAVRGERIQRIKIGRLMEVAAALYGAQKV